MTSRTLFFGSFKLNIKLLYLFLYLESVSRKKENSSFSILVATFAALSSAIFRVESASLKNIHILHFQETARIENLNLFLKKNQRYLFSRISLSDCLTLCLIWSAEGLATEALGGCTLLVVPPFSLLFFFPSCLSWQPMLKNNERNSITWFG